MDADRRQCAGQQSGNVGQPNAKDLESDWESLPLCIRRQSKRPFGEQTASTAIRQFAAARDL